MEPILIVEHGTAEEIARGADAFARFYIVQFYDVILKAYVKRRRSIFIMVAVIAALLMIFGLMPVLLGIHSIFAWLLLIMSGMLLVAVIVCVMMIYRAPGYCKEHLATFFEGQLTSAKSASRAVSQSHFYEDRLETFLGAPGVGKRKVRNYREISCVYETDEIYFFKGIGWIHKERLSKDESDKLRAIIADIFGADRHVWVDVVLE